MAETGQVERVVEALINADKPAERDTLGWYWALARAALDAATPPIPEGVRWSPEFHRWACSECGTEGTSRVTAADHQCPGGDR